MAEIPSAYRDIEPALEETAPQNWLDRHTLTRRGLFVGAGLAAGARALGRLDAELMNAAFPPGHTDIDWMPGCLQDKKMDVVSVASPGWDGTNGRTIGDRLVEQQVYAPTFPSAYFTFDGRVTPGSVYDCSRNFEQRYQPNKMDIHAVSEGMMIALMGALAMERPLRLVTANASPFDIGDTKHAFWAKVIANANQIGLYEGGVVGKLTAMMGRQVEEEGIDQLKDGWGDAWDATWEGVDPRVLVSQTAFLDEIQLMDRRFEFKNKRIINSDTVAIFMMAEDPNSDRVVKLEQALQKWEKFFTFCGARFSVIRIPAPGHARMTAGIEAGAAKMRQIISSYA